jgi:hypothetical protein
MNTRTGPILLGALLVLFALPAQAAKGPQAVRYTVHNLSSEYGGFYDNYYSDNEDEICIFCHTPHGGDLSGPLWNRSNPAISGAAGDLETGPFTHYNSVTLSSKISNDYRPVSDESLLCLSCHDGSVALNRVLNTSNDGQPTIGGGDTFIAYFVGVIGGLIGKNANIDDDTIHRDLSDDHPISFSYTEVQSTEEEKLHTVFDAAASGVRFFGPTARLECSSCHDPHVDYDSDIPDDGTDTLADETYRPFLITPNTGSALCLACHDK